MPPPEHDDIGFEPEPVQTSAHDDVGFEPDGPPHQVQPAPAPAPKPSLTDRVASGLGELAFRSSPVGNAYSLYQTVRGVPQDQQTKEHADLMRAGLQGVTLGHAGKMLEEDGDPGAAAQYKAAAADHPVANFVGGMAVPVPGVGPLKALKGVGGVAARMGASGLIGAGMGAASADTNLSLPARAGVGFGAGVLGGGFSEGLGALAGKASDKIRLASADAAQAVDKATAKTARSARSAVGGNTANVLSLYDTASKIAQATGQHPYTPEQVVKAKALMADPEFIAAVRHAADNALELAPDKLRGDLLTSKNVWDTAKAARAPEAIEAAAEESMKDPIRRAVLPRALRMAQHSVPPVIGGAVGGVPGAMVGAATAGVMGNPNRTIANMMRDPGVRRMLWESVQRSAKAGQSALPVVGAVGQRMATTSPPDRDPLGPYGPAISAAMKESPDKALALHHALADHDPDYQERLQQLLDQQD